MLKKLLLVVVGACLGGIAAAQGWSPKLQALIDQKDKAVLEKELRKLEDSKVESDLKILIEYYGYKMDQKNYDAITEKTVKLFPEGETALSQALDVVYTEQDGPSNEKNYARFVAKYGNIPALKGHRYFEFAKYYVAVSFTNEDPAKVEEWINKISEARYRFDAYAWSAKLLAASGFNKDAERFAKLTLTERQQKKQTTGKEYEEVLGEVAGYLLANGKYAEGLNYAQQVKNSEITNSPEFKTTYLGLLVGTGKYEEAFPGMEKAILDGSASTLIKEHLPKAFYAVKGKSADYNAYYADLMKSFKDDINKKVLAKMVKQPAYNFSVQMVDGGTVTLESLRGKVVIVDFWATWCGPCKASFPMMQLAVNRYKNDPDVYFLFIHTWENSPNPVKDAGNYIKSNNYTFNVGMDLKDADKKNRASAGFNVQGIPAKFIIDKSGNIRFTSSGGGKGGEDAFLAEMDAMIEAARKG